jgi:imidazole glycerol phosphate synthase subunit HisF
VSINNNLLYELYFKYIKIIFIFYNTVTGSEIEHFSEVFEKTDVEAALAAGIFHREEVPIEAVKEHMRERGIETR